MTVEEILEEKPEISVAEVIAIKKDMSVEEMVAMKNDVRFFSFSFLGEVFQEILKVAVKNDMRLAPSLRSTSRCPCWRSSKSRTS